MAWHEELQEIPFVVDWQFSIVTGSPNPSEFGDPGTSVNQPRSIDHFPFR